MKTHIHEDPNRTTPLGLVRYADEFREAAIAVDDSLGKKPGFEIVAPIPVLYLVGHSIELSLKAFLLYKGVTLNDLKINFGHDLGKCYMKAQELGLLNFVKFENEENEAFDVLNDLYSTKQLEYIVTGSKQFPVFGLIQTFSKKLLDTLGPMVGYR